MAQEGVRKWRLCSGLNSGPETALALIMHAMAPMGIRLSPLGMAVFSLLWLGVLYHLYSGFLASCFGLGSEPAAGEAEVAFTSK
jgi:hypothetical protein